MKESEALIFSFIIIIITCIIFLFSTMPLILINHHLNHPVLSLINLINFNRPHHHHHHHLISR